MKITKIDGKLMVPDTPTIPFVEGDGVGAEVTPVMQAVVNAPWRRLTPASAR